MPSLSRRGFIKTNAGIATGVSLTSAGRADGRTQSSAFLWGAEARGNIYDYHVTGSNAYLGTDQGQIRSINIGDGTGTGHLNLSEGIYWGGLEVTSDYLLLMTQDNLLRAYDRHSLSEVWTKSLSTKPQEIAARDEGVAILTRDTLRVLKLSDGRDKWEPKNDTWGPPLIWHPEAGLVLGRNKDYDDNNAFGFASWGVHTVDPATGKFVTKSEEGSFGRYSQRPGYVTEITGEYVGVFGAIRRTTDNPYHLNVVNASLGTLVYSEKINERMAGTVNASKRRGPSIGLTESIVVHSAYENPVKVVNFQSGNEIGGSSILPTDGGIDSNQSQTVIAGQLNDGAAIVRSFQTETQNVKWQEEINFPLSYISLGEERLFGVDVSNGRLVALSSTEEAIETPTYTPTSTITPTGTDSPSQTVNSPNGGAETTSAGGEILTRTFEPNLGNLLKLFAAMVTVGAFFRKRINNHIFDDSEENSQDRSRDSFER